MSIYASFRLVFMLATALLIATLVASSAAHGLVLGDAVAQSALGSPLRVVIPVTDAPDVALQPNCFQLVPAPGDGSAPIVTARVSLVRGASGAKLVVMTPNPVNEPAIRFSIQVGCGESSQRVYVLLLDPPASDTSTAAAVTPTVAREGRPAQPVAQPASARRIAGGIAMPEPPATKLPVTAEYGSALTVAAYKPSAPEGAAAVVPAAFRQASGTPALAGVVGAPPLTRHAASSESGLWYFVAMALAVVGVIVLSVRLARRRDTRLEIPQWTRSHSGSGPRTFADVSTAPLTLPNTLSHARAKMPPATTQPPRVQPRPAASSELGVEAPTPRSRPRYAPVDASTIDTLLDEADPDIVEERAVREAWAAARSNVELELDADAILQAIEAAERDLQLTPTEHVHSAIERSLDDDLLQPQRHH